MVSIERSVYYREKAAGLYSAIPYALSQVLIEVPYVIVQATLYSVITYSMLGFEWTAAKFFWYYYITVVSLLQFTYYGMMMVAITPNVILASIVSAFFSTLFNLYAGFLIPRPVSLRNLVNTANAASFFSSCVDDVLCLVLDTAALQVSEVLFVLIPACSRFPHGGYGTIGSARWHGLCTD
jgi:ABC-type multidrug transport system permease subunit